MSLGERRRAVAEAEARLAAASGQLKASWHGLREDGAAALTPGRVVLIGLLSGFVGGQVLPRGGGDNGSGEAARPGPGGDWVLALLRLLTAMLPTLMPSLAPVFQAGMAAGRGAGAPGEGAGDSG